MPDKFHPALVALWIERIYFQSENWDRLRTVGKVKTLADGIEQLIFFPLKQRSPGLDEQTHPEMKDPIMNEILSSYNTVSDACDFMNEPYQCNVQRESSSLLGKKLKVLLRKSNNTYPHLFTDITSVPSTFSILEQAPNKNPYVGYIPVMDIHAYDNSILIAGGPIANASDWPKGYPVKEVDYSRNWSYRGFVGENIVLPSTVDNVEFGELIKSVWRAKTNSLFSIEN